MKKWAALNVFAAWLVLAVALGLLPGPAQAYVYDDFTGTGIDMSRWVVSDPNPGLFSQPGEGDSYLYFNDPSPGGQSDKLRSFNSVSGAFFVSMQYANFQTVNNTAFYLSGSSAGLWIAYSTKKLKVYEFKNASYQGFYALFIDGENKSPLDTFIPSGVTSGRLGIGYDGTSASLWYDAGLGWKLYTTYAPGFASDPYFGIEGYNLNGESLSFKVDQVRLDPVPLPAGVWLLGSGLLGLAGLGRILKRN